MRASPAIMMATNIRARIILLPREGYTVPTSFTAAGTGTPDSVSHISATEYRRRQMLRLPHAAPTEQRALLRKASRRLPGSSAGTGEETQRVAAWPRTGNSRRAGQRSEKAKDKMNPPSPDFEAKIKRAPAVKLSRPLISFRGLPNPLNRATSKVFRHPNIAVDGGCWNCHVSSIARGNGPARPNAVHLPDLVCIAR